MYVVAFPKQGLVADQQTNYRNLKLLATVCCIVAVQSKQALHKFLKFLLPVECLLTFYSRYYGKKN